ncbi:MAG: potassium channel protein [Planctomycetota bacterium]|nr:potassium channel protein [Planctomycetota bacterium]
MAQQEYLTISSPRYKPLHLFRWGMLVLFGLTVFSTLVYYVLGLYYGRDDWTLLHCLFMVVITLSTIGYGDWLDIKNAPLAIVFTMGLAILGIGVPAFVIANVTALIVEGMFGNLYRRRRMLKQIEDMRDHIIVCGVGTTGIHVVEELVKTQRAFVVIDRDLERLGRVAEVAGDFPYVIGSADDDDILKTAGIERAHGLVACLTDDKDNLYITLTARRLNQGLRIISKVIDPRAAPKLLAAGANSTVNPTAIGGLRLVSELVRPTVVTFLDSMLRDQRQNFRFEELTVAQGSKVAGKSLAAAELRKVSDVLVVAARAPRDDRFCYNPKADFLLEPGCTVVLLGRSEDLLALHPLFGTSSAA